MKHHYIAIKSVILFLFLAITSLTAAAMQNKHQEWYFNVYLDDTPIGYHHFIQVNDDTQKIFIKAEFDVKLLFFSIYNYLHENSETWEGQCLKELSSSTNDNGEQQFVSFYKQNNDYIIKTEKRSITVNNCIRSFAYWNPDLLQSRQLLNAQTGELVDIELKNMGKNTLLVNKTPVESEQYRLLGKDIEIDLWYSPDKQWLALESKTESGSILRYELQQGGMK